MPYSSSRLHIAASCISVLVHFLCTYQMSVLGFVISISMCNLRPNQWACLVYTTRTRLNPRPGCIMEMDHIALDLNRSASDSSRAINGSDFVSEGVTKKI